MARRDSDAAIQTARLIQTVDDGRSLQDAFKLTATLRHELDTRLTALINAENNQQGASGNRLRDSERVKTALPVLTNLLRDGYNHIKALPSYTLTSAERSAAFEAYGWNGGKIGGFQSFDRVLALARKASAATHTVEPIAARYPKELLTRIQAQLTILDESGAGAKVGTRQQATKARNEALQALTRINARVRLYYASSSDELDRTAELAKIGLNPRSPSTPRRVPTDPAPPAPSPQ